MRSTDRRRTRKILGLTVTTVGFPWLWRNVVSISGPHLLWWKKIELYKRPRVRRT